MYSATHVTVALCLALAVCSATVVPKTTDKQKANKIEIAMPPEGLIMDLLVRSRNTHEPMAKLKIDINERSKKVVLALIPEPSPDILSALDDRTGIVVGTCPEGYTKVGGFCYKDDTDY